MNSTVVFNPQKENDKLWEQILDLSKRLRALEQREPKETHYHYHYQQTTPVTYPTYPYYTLTGGISSTCQN